MLVYLNLNFNFMYTVHILECNVQSCGLARNEGLNIATGNYIWFIDGDDWLINNKAIFTILRTIRRKNRQIVRFNYEYPDSFKFPVKFKGDFVKDDKPYVIVDIKFKKKLIIY